MASTTEDGLRPAARGSAAPPSLAPLALWFCLVTFCAQAVTIGWGGPFPRDASGLVVGRDFLNMWMYGQAAWSADPWRWYDVGRYQADMAALLGPGYPGQNWSYPPTVMLLAAGLGLLPYLPALALWTGFGLWTFVAALRRRAGDRPLIAASLCSPAAVLGILAGQYALVATAILVLVFRLLDRRPWLAGVLIGLLTLKPQVGLLFPVLLVATGRWRTFLSAAISGLAIAAAAAAVFGTKAWLDFVRLGIPTQDLVLADPEKTAGPFMPTVFMNLRVAGASYGAAMTVQLCVAACAVAALVWFCRARRQAGPRELWLVFSACSVSASPYLLSYDLLPLTVCIVAALAAGRLDARSQTLAKAVYWLPLIQLVLGTYGVPGAGVLVPAFTFLLIARHLREPDAPGRPGAPGLLRARA